MHLFNEFREMVVPYDLVVLITAHHGIAVAKQVVGRSEYLFVQELILREEVQRIVRDGSSREYDVEFGLLAEFM